MPFGVPRRTGLLSPLLCAILVLGCTAEREDRVEADSAVDADSVTDVVAPGGDTAPETAPSESSPSGSDPDGDDPDGGADPAEASDTDADPSRGSGAVGEPAGGSAYPAWRTTEIRSQGPGGDHEVRDVRVARHGDFDRFVVEFSGGGLPTWRVTPSTGPSTDCGSGREVELAGRSLLDVEFTSARAHTEEGRSTLSEREPSAGFPAIRRVHMTCDFEAHVSWALGIAEDPTFRVFELTSPPRLVVDVRH